MIICKARRVQDEMQCGQCGLTWDIKSAAPRCRPAVYNETEAAEIRRTQSRYNTAAARRAAEVRRRIDEIKHQLELSKI